ncbi:MAG: tRNA pseudouridine(55) synthase TruB [Proteobacteria bacterium]|nr:tRNA pseudouridine(55) synthase TruB [Pseudomonadota bacterium]
MAQSHSRPRKRRGRPVNGILLLDKPIGVSSNAALQAAKRLFGAAKAGHTGNLDVEATGLLPVCFGEATKVCQFLLDADKRYLSEFTLGRRTTTGDSEGETVYERSTEGLTRQAVEDAIAHFRGAIEQLPPMHSALKHKGQPLYKLAHQGIEVERQKRTVTIHSYEVLAFDNPRLEVAVGCSKGTYVRTLAEDLGEMLGCGGYVSRLRRDGVGPYQLADAWTLERLEWLAQRGEAELDRSLLPIDGALTLMPRVDLTAESSFYLERGNAVLVPKAPTSGLLRLYDDFGRFIGVGEVLSDGRVAPRRLFRLPVTEANGESARSSA